MSKPNRPNVFNLHFPCSSSKSVESTFDTCIWFGAIFQEYLHNNFQKRSQGKTAKELIEEFSDEQHFLSVLDTVSWEFSEVVSKKVENLYMKIIHSLNEAKERITAGEKEAQVIKEISNRLQQDSHYSSVYNHFQIRGKGFPKIYSNKEARINFFRELFSLPLYAQENFNVMTRKYPKRYVKETIMLWINDNEKFFFLFKEKAKKIDKKDRFHILGSIMINCAKKRPVDFITFDQNIFNCSDDVIKFLEANRKRLETQFRSLLLEESIST
ncbi:MAG: hypothetical protein ACTSPG_06015 [Candidatus Hodarchaeales archaeon]